MNEKRFIRNIVGDIYDSEKDKWFEEDWKGKPIDYDDDLIVFLNELVTKCHRLEKENDRLRQQLKTKVIVNKQYEEKERLKKENRVLKKDLNKLYNLLIDKGMSHNELQDVLMVIDDE